MYGERARLSASLTLWQAGFGRLAVTNSGPARRCGNLPRFRDVVTPILGTNVTKLILTVLVALLIAGCGDTTESKPQAAQTATVRDACRSGERSADKTWVCLDGAWKAAKAESAAPEKAELPRKPRPRPEPVVTQEQEVVEEPFADGLRSAATNLAVIDGKSEYDDGAITEREAAIQELQRWCRRAAPSRLADMATVSKQAIEESGTSVSTLQVLQGVGTAASADVGIACSEIFAAYVILVQSGESP